MRALAERCPRPLGWLLLALVVLCSAAGASADTEEFEEGGFGRRGFYVGVGASFGLPMAGWQDGVDGEMSRASNDAAQASADALEDSDPNLVVQELTRVRIKTSGSDLDTHRFGAGGVVGYRLAPLVAIEVEGEWLANTGRTSFTITDSGDTGTAEIQDLFTVTGNVRLYPFSGRLQPFGIFGLGLVHSEVDLDVDAPNVTTTALVFDRRDNSETVRDLEAGFGILRNRTQLDGAFRVGLGLDAYWNENVAAELKADYVLPFDENAFVSVDYLSLRLGLLYRF